MEGRLIQTSTYNRYNKTVRLEDYAPGLYLVRVVTVDNEEATFKILHR